MPTCFLILCLGQVGNICQPSFPSQLDKTVHESLTEPLRGFSLLLFTYLPCPLKAKLHLPTRQGEPMAAPWYGQLTPSPQVLLASMMLVMPSYLQVCWGKESSSQTGN